MVLQGFSFNKLKHLRITSTQLSPMQVTALYMDSLMRFYSISMIDKKLFQLKVIQQYDDQLGCLLEVVQNAKNYLDYQLQFPPFFRLCHANIRVLLTRMKMRCIYRECILFLRCQRMQIIFLKQRFQSINGITYYLLTKS